MSVFNRIRQLVSKIPLPVRSAGEIVLNTLLPGGPEIVRLVKETVDWATNNAPAPSASTGDQERVEEMLKILQNQLDAIAEKVDRFPSPEQVRGYVRGCVINDPDMPDALRDLDTLARRFDVLQASHLQLLKQQHFNGELLQQLLVLTGRLVGVSDLASDLRRGNTAYPDFDTALQFYQAGAMAFSQGRLQTARQEFEALKSKQPSLPISSIAVDTVMATQSPANNPQTASLVDSILRRIPPPQLSKKLSLKYPISDGDIAATFTGHSSLQELILWNCSNLTDAGLSLLCNMLPRLAKLSIRKGYKITDHAIPSLLRLSELQSLLLWGTQVTNKGTNQLPRLREMSTR